MGITAAHLLDDLSNLHVVLAQKRLERGSDFLRGLFRVEDFTVWTDSHGSFYDGCLS